MSDRPRRSPAERAALGGATAVLAALVGLILAQVPGDDRPALPAARVEAVHERGGAFHVEVTVRNRGDATASNVQVSAELTVDGATTSGDQVVDFVSGGEDESLTFVFTEDPGDGELTVEVTGFAEP